MAKIGYIRVSARDQNEARQVHAFEPLDLDKVFLEKISGKTTDRPEFQKMLSYLREGDTLYIESLSRLARSLIDTITTINQLREKGVDVISLKEKIDTSSPQGKFITNIFGALYELEREMILERQAEGIAAALESGAPYGRPKKEINNDFIKAYQKWKNKGLTALEAMKLADMKPNTWYRRVKEYEQEHSVDDLLQAAGTLTPERGKQLEEDVRFGS